MEIVRVDVSVAGRSQGDGQGRQGGRPQGDEIVRVDVSAAREDKNSIRIPVQGHNRPNQGGKKKSLQNSERLFKANSSAGNRKRKKPEVKEITLRKMTIRELAEAMKMQPSVIVKKLFMEGNHGNCKP